MTGMVPMVANVFSLPSGRIVSAAGHQLPGLWEAIHHTLFTLSGTGETLLPVFKKIHNAMINLHRLPLGIRREDFDTEADYQYALENYDDLYNMAEDIAMDDYYEKKYGKIEK